MVKIRLRRIGTKGRPFYRVVVAHSTAGRNGKFIENIGTYDPLTTPKVITIDEERAMHWLMSGAQPTETTAYLLNKIGVLPKYLEARPTAKKQFDYLDKTTASISKPSSVGAGAAPEAKPEPAAAAAPAPEPVEEAEPEAVSAEPEAAPEAAPEQATEPEATPEASAEEASPEVAADAREAQPEEKETP